MKKFLTIALVVLLVGGAGLYGYGYIQSGANDDALAAIKDKPGVIVLQVEGMT